MFHKSDTDVWINLSLFTRFYTDEDETGNFHSIYAVIDNINERPIELIIESGFDDLEDAESKLDEIMEKFNKG